ncbi:C2 domain-containing protein 3 [Rhinophrynus dorsalis]
MSLVEDITDISPSTSLPPLVEGQLRCFLRVSVNKILWTVPRPPSFVLVRLRWWGETSDGTVFRPRDTSLAEQKGVKTTTRYAVRCGPKQLTSYLTDMGALVFDIMTKLDHFPIGRVQINGIPQLSSEHPISGFFTIVSPTSDKLGELQVSVALEPLSETYDNMSSVHNSDLSLDTAVPESGAHTKDETTGLIDPSQPSKSLISADRRDTDGSSRATTPRGRDHLYFQENGDPIKDPFRGSQDHLKRDHHITEVFPSKNQIPSTYSSQDPPSAAPDKDIYRLTSGPATKDLLSALLDQGSKLRDAMVVSALKSAPDVDLNIDLMPVLNNDNYTSSAARTAPDVLSPTVLLNLLNAQKSPPSRDTFPPATDGAQPELGTPTDTRAIELLLGSSALSPAHYWDGSGSPPESMTGSDIYNESELNDPHYDQSLLENLFYTAPGDAMSESRKEKKRRAVRLSKQRTKSDVSLSDLPSDEDATKSSRKKAKDTVTKERELRLVQSQMEHKSSAQKGGADVSIRESRTPERSHKGTSKSTTVDLTMDRLSLLGRMHVACVIVESLRIPTDSTQVTPSKRSTKGKPPRPATAVKQTYFVEFHFPVSSKNRTGEVSVATEITRLVSSKIMGGSVKFQQRFMFPVTLSRRMIEHWWNTDLTFRIFLRKGSQKKPEFLGSAFIPLCDVLQSAGLSVTCSLPVICTEEHQGISAVGPLKVSVELAGDKDVLSLPDKTSGSEKQISFSSTVRGKGIAEPETSASDSEMSPPSHPVSYMPPAQHITPLPLVTEGPQLSLPQDLQQPDEEDGLLLHVVLMVPEGKGFIPAGGELSSICNSYINCKLFSGQEATRSHVVWGTAQPTFNFSQVAPVSLTSRLLERLKNNMMIIEVWNKVPSPGPDQLLGLTKLPLHQFYMSFSDPKISRLLLQAQYPVVAVDSFVPITDVFSGNERGKLKVLLAMGSGDQVIALQRLKNDEVTSTGQVPRPSHFLDPPQASLQVARPQQDISDHIFEIHVENVKGLIPLQSTVWGEADCFVQYYFPAHSPDFIPGAELPEMGINLKPVRTATTLCVPDPVFNDRQSHSLVTPSNTPVQRLLLSAYSLQGLSGGGGVPFEIWCRYYYPNVRDQMVAKGVLPLSRLCAMVTMQHREEVGIQAFSLPLIPRSESPGEQYSQSSGLLNVNVTYRRSVRNPAGMLATRMASISVQIHRASGLQAAARLVAEHDRSFQYSADVGVNAYITIHLTFLPEAERRTTRTVARSFSPEFDHHSEFPCNLVIQRSNGEACSLAEILRASEIMLSIHHQNVVSATTSRPHPAGDYHLGVVRIPARELITKRSGITGWYPVTAPEDSPLPSTTSILQNIVGGLELSISFAHHSDRERVLEVARGLGWTEDEDDVREVTGHGVDEWQNKEDLVNLSVTIPKIWLPVHSLLLAGHKNVHKSTYCYVRYKFYDKEAICSPLKRPTLLEDGQQATVVFELTENTELMKHQPLVWYLREERLEIQVWRSYGKDTSGPRPQDTDRLIGCAYVDLTALSETTSRTLTVSGVYPMFKRNISNLWGAAVRVHLTLSSAYHSSTSARAGSNIAERNHSEEEASDDLSEEHYEEKQDLSVKTHTAEASTDVPVPNTSHQPVDVDLENTFAVNIVVERAMHLSLKGSPLTERAVLTPSCCVSFPVAGSATPVTTPVVENTDAPLWNFQHQSRLTKELLLDPRQTLVFKVWHKADVERVLGFASVDLSPLLSGFQSVCGWYNIVDFAGQCQGQVKVSVTPLESIAHLKEQRRVGKESANTQSEAMSQRSFLYQPSMAFCGSFSSYNSNRSQELPSMHSISTAQYQATERREDVSVFPSLRHEEHMQNVRRFHESLQQAEQNTHSAEHLHVLSQSSRTSLLSALRKNLSELDDIQKYFNQKLYRSIPSRAPSADSTVQNTQVHPPDNTSAEQQEEESDAQQLLKKSSFLVSQVSSLITGLQGVTKVAKPPTTLLEDLDLRGPASMQQGEDVGPMHLEESFANENERQEVDTPCFASVGSPPPSGRLLDGFLEQGMSEQLGHIQVDTHQVDLDEQNTLCGSDEEYEEDLIEPKTLNELTSMTDRTSPWSSILSDTEPDFMGQPQNDRQEQPGDAWTLRHHSIDTEPFSSFHQCDDPSNPSSPMSGELQAFNIEPKLGKMRSDPSDDTESDRESQSSRRQREQEGLVEEAQSSTTEKRKEEVQGEAIPVFESMPSEPSPGSSDPEESSVNGTSTIRESESSPQELGDVVSGCSDSEDLQRSAGPSGESPGDLLEMTENPTTQASDLLPEPIRVPNFFLPPQHLEASMRILSLSPALPSTTADKEGNKTQITKGIPFRRPARQKPKLTSADLPEEETNRIARIFAAKFSNNK